MPMLSRIKSVIPHNKYVYSVIGITTVIAGSFLGYHGIKTFSEFGTRSEGIAVGMLYNYTLSGPLTFTTGEGEIHLGRDSTPWIENGVTRNPFHFSSTQKVWNDSSELQGQTVVAYYFTRQWKFNNWNGDTNTRVWKFEKVKPENLKVCGKVNHSTLDNIVNKQTGNPAGRIVDVHREGFWRFSPTISEITVQLSDAGNKFMDLSIVDDDIYECALNFAITGQMVRIGFLKKPYRSVWRNIDYVVTGFELVGGK